LDGNHRDVWGSGAAETWPAAGLRARMENKEVRLKGEGGRLAMMGGTVLVEISAVAYTDGVKVMEDKHFTWRGVSSWWRANQTCRRWRGKWLVHCVLVIHTAIWMEPVI